MKQLPALLADAAGVVRWAQGKPTLVSGNTAAMVRCSGLLAFVACDAFRHSKKR
jgi:hypothetical protein